jgi:hypothetical protein
LDATTGAADLFQAACMTEEGLTDVR